MKKWEKILYILSAILIILSIFMISISKDILNPQDDYATFLMKTNDAFVLGMYDFSNLMERLDTGEDNKSLCDEMSKIVVNQNNLVKEIEKNAPNNENADFYDLTENVRELYLFYLQGEIYLLEQGYYPKEERNESLLGMGNALTNTMGDTILKLPDKINGIRSTNIIPNYSYVPKDDVEKSVGGEE